MVGDLFFLAEMERFSRLRPKSRLRRLASDTPACGQPSRTALRAARALTLPLPPNKKPRPTGRGFVWRRWRDSNSRRAFDPYTISNRARSTNYATSPRVCSRRPYQLVSLPIIMHANGKVKHVFACFSSRFLNRVRTERERGMSHDLTKRAQRDIVLALPRGQTPGGAADPRGTGRKTLEKGLEHPARRVAGAAAVRLRRRARRTGPERAGGGPSGHGRDRRPRS